MSSNSSMAAPIAEMPANYDVIIIGGSTAGLSTALILGRSLRRVLVIDSGQPCNRQTPHSHGFLTRDGITPGQLLSLAKEQALAYPTVTFLDDTVVHADRLEEGGFAVKTAAQSSFFARKILLATGVKDLMPPIDGFAQCWGRSVLHCPYCHGFEVHSQRLGVLGNGDAGYEFVRLLQQWSRQLTLFTNGPSILTADQQRDVQQLGVTVIESPIARIEHEDGFMRGVHLQDGGHVALTALFARVPFRQHTDLANQLGCELTATGLIAVAEFGQTNVPGVYAAGDNSSPLRQLGVASANGTKAGSWINRQLIDEDLTVTLHLSTTGV